MTTGSAETWKHIILHFNTDTGYILDMFYQKERRGEEISHLEIWKTKNIGAVWFMSEKNMQFNVLKYKDIFLKY